MLRAVLATAVLATGALLGALPEAQAQSLVPCARENGFCRVPYPTRVIYGIPGRSAEVFVREGGIPCSNGAFGDPAPGVPKRCAYMARRYDRGDRWRDDGYRGPPRGYERGHDRGFRDYDDGYERPVRRYNVY
ncbi:MAG TPA: hypothetical protein VKA61_02675 [Sphingomicrobium sp.]|nr:hypothetical protein [Sphingomicrobium sp.]